jgi:CBS domain containing-hemolysin-like protein
MFLLVLFATLAIAILFICFVLEAVLLSITPSYITTLKDENPKAAKRIKALKDKVDQPLAAILSLNTIAHTAGAAGVGAQAASLFGDTAVGIASAVMTLLVLLFSEIIPKTLGANHWRTLAPYVASVLVWLVAILKPFVWMSDMVTRLFSEKQDEGKYLRSEIEALAVMGRQAGVLHKNESEIIQGLLQFKHTKLRSILTPRKQLFRIHKDMTVEEFCRVHGSVSYSRILIYDNDNDDIIGFVLKSDVMLAPHRVRPDFKVAKMVKPIYTVSENMSLPRLFRNMLERRVHISLVVDEYGDVQGVVSLEDLLESLLQVNILDEQDRQDETSAEELNKWQELYDFHEQEEVEMNLDTASEQESETDVESASKNKTE